jgi:hypothetical protein
VFSQLHYESVFRTTFFGDLDGVEGEIIHVMLVAGEAIFIPAGFIHFVATVTESIVFGTNFLTFVELPISAAAFKHERVSGVRRDNCFPHYEAVVVLVALRRFVKRSDILQADAFLKLRNAVQTVLLFPQTSGIITTVLAHVRFLHT